MYMTSSAFSASTNRSGFEVSISHGAQQGKQGAASSAPTPFKMVIMPGERRAGSVGCIPGKLQPYAGF